MVHGDFETRSARVVARLAAAFLLVAFATGGSCGETSNPNPDCGDGIYTPLTWTPGTSSGDLDVASGYAAADGRYFVEFSRTWSNLCLERSDEFNKTTCTIRLVGVAASGLPAEHTVQCSVMTAILFQPYRTTMVQDGASPNTYSGTVGNIGLRQGAQQRSSTRGIAIGALRLEYPTQGGGDAANRAYADTIIHSVVLTPNFLLTKSTAP